jgi:catechol 2,3-dioxygenase-like lactoylglutathione lyase family enzyme
MDHVGIVVDDLAAATEFLRRARTRAAGRRIGREPVGGSHRGARGRPYGVRIHANAGGHGRLELIKFHSPSHQGDKRHAPANTPGLRHLAFVVDNIDAVVARLRARGGELVGEVESYKDSYRLCYVRGPDETIIELAEQIG